jgi:hypothetical protein
MTFRSPNRGLSAIDLFLFATASGWEEAQEGSFPALTHAHPVGISSIPTLMFGLLLDFFPFFFPRVLFFLDFSSFLR